MEKTREELWVTPSGSLSVRIVDEAGNPVEAEKPVNPAMDHDGNNKTGGTKPPMPETEQAELTATEDKYADMTNEDLATALRAAGVKVDNRWGRARLIAETEKLSDA